MKICFIANGSEDSVFTRMWIDHFRRKKHDVSLITYNKPNAVYYDLCTVKYIPQSNFLKLVSKTRKTIKEIDPDVLAAIYLEGCGFYGSLSGFHPFLAIPLGSDIATYPDSSRYARFKTKHILKKADLVQVQDALSAERVKQLGCLESKILLNKWGVDLQRFKPSNIKKEYDVINLHGNSFKQRDVMTFLKAIAIVKKRIPDIKCLLLGKEFPSLGYAKQLDILDNIEFGGFVDGDELQNYLRRSRIFVDCFDPMHYHGGHTYGMALLEAMACGIPTVVANKQTIYKLDIIDRWYFGKTFSGGVEEQLAHRIIDLLNNKTEADEISRLNRRVIEEKFDWNKNIAKIESVIARRI